MIRCPTPHKVRLESRREAKTFRKHGWKRATTKLDNRVRPYLCECGFWHLGHLGNEVITGEKTRKQAYNS